MTDTDKVKRQKVTCVSKSNDGDITELGIPSAPCGITAWYELSLTYN